MNADTVYTVSQSLSNEERYRLYNMLKQDYDIKIPKSKGKKKLEFSEGDALRFLHEKLF